MQTQSRSSTLATGLAMFSMFFGAGNVVFPLATGLFAKDLNFYSILGLLISAVGVPFLGLIAMTLYNGNYRNFFERIGHLPGFIVAVMILCLIGPFGAMPRCITLSYSTAKIYLPFLDLVGFSLISCVVIFLLTFKRNNLLDILGYFLTPVLLGSLGLLIVKGLIDAPAAPVSDSTPWATFLHGLGEGYQTMDLLGAFFFSSVVLESLEIDVKPGDKSGYRQMMVKTMKAGCIGAGLLALVYVGFSYIAAFHSGALGNIATDELIGRIAALVLGHWGGLVACIAVALACLTTAIALGVVFAEFIQRDLSKHKLSYTTSLLITLAITFVVSTFNFKGIAQFLAPILYVCYPALITLSILNILRQLYDFRFVKMPVLVVFLASIISYFFI